MKASTAKHLAMGPKDKEYVRAGELFEQFTAGGLSSALWLADVCQLTGKRCKVCHCHIPARDHVRGFIDRKTRKRVLTVHPYFSVRKADGEIWGMCDASEGEPVVDVDSGEPLTIPEFTAHCEAFAKEHGLTVKISMDSWYYPGRTLLVEYRKEAA
jgi:hypothetical protein